MKYYAMETEDGATLYFDGHGGAIVDIDIPDGVETITFSAENEFGGQYQCVYLKSVLKQFPDVKEIKINSFCVSFPCALIYETSITKIFSASSFVSIPEVIKQACVIPFVL